MADQDGLHSDLIMQLLRQIVNAVITVTSSPHYADVKGDIFRLTIYPLSLVFIAFIFLELLRGDYGAGGTFSAPRLPVEEDQKSPI